VRSRPQSTASRFLPRAPFLQKDASKGGRAAAAGSTTRGASGASGEPFEGLGLDLSSYAAFTGLLSPQVRWGRGAGRRISSCASRFFAAARPLTVFSPFRAPSPRLARARSQSSARPKARPLAWLMRHVEEMYDARYAKDTADLRGEAAGDGGDGGDGAAGATPFPQFVVDFFSKRYGLRSLIDQLCVDLLFNVHVARREHPEVETFARFLEAFYDADDLLFFLYVRSVVQKELGVSLRTRWTELGRAAAEGGAAGGGGGGGGAPAPLYLSARECALVSRTVFGSEADPLYRAFMSVLDRHLSAAGAGAASKRARAPGGGDARRVEHAQFLHLALVEYHETRPAEGAEVAALSAGAAAAAVERLGAYSPASPGSASRAAAAAAAAATARRPALPPPLPASPAAAAAAATAAAAAASAPGAALLLRRSPQFFDELGEAMHRANEAYLDRSLAAAAALPAEVQAQIRAELQQQLEAKLDAILSATIKATQAGAPPSGAPARDALVAHFARVMTAAAAGAAAGDAAADASIDGFCAAVLALAEVRETIEPLVSLLINYASSRLEEVAAGGE
jgi:hypothetical protein